MIKTLIFVLLFLCWRTGRAQAYDQKWLIGGLGFSTLTFNGGVIDTGTFTSNVVAIRALSNISDTNGNLLFYTNGIAVASSNGNIMAGGDTLPDSTYYAINSPYVGLVYSQTNIILPRSANTYYVFYMSQSDSLFATLSTDDPDRLYYAVVDMSQMAGLGKVTSKRNVAYKGMFGSSRLTACRHGNGRDWWLVHQGHVNDEYFIYLVTPDSVYPPLIQHIGPPLLYDDAAEESQSAFSPDGSKFATCGVTPVGISGPLLIMDFDRCSGIFSNPDSIYVPSDSYTASNGITYYSNGGSTGCCFSPNSRFVYITNSTVVWQYDTWAANVASSVLTIGYASPDSILGPYQMGLMPNGQIVMDNWQGNTNAFHLIDSPDVQGPGCQFQLGGLVTSTLNANVLPNMINYRLGALSGSPCDTAAFAHVFDTICQGMSVYVPGHSYTVSGIYTDTLIGRQGQDSIVTRSLTVTKALQSQAADTIINGDSVFVGEHIYKQPGIYIDTLTNAAGCDSIVTLHLSVWPNGISEIGDHPMHLYPNPNRGIFTLQTSYSTGRDYTISDMLGNVISHQVIKSNNQSIELPDAIEGVYTLTVKGAQPIRFVIVR